MSDKIKQAELLATFVHFGQKRQDGEDYINHPKRLVLSYIRIITNSPNLMWEDIDYKLLNLSGEQINIICANWLHDCIEDSTSSDIIAHLIEETFGGEVYELVYILTHVKDKESYIEYITKVFQHPAAWQIKWLDMIDNTSYPIPDKQKTKYRDACIHLISHGVTVPDILKKRLEI